MSSAPNPPRKRNRRGHGNLLHDELLDAALRVMEDPDNDGRLSIRAVAAEAAVAPQSVYLQFSDAASLRWAAFGRLFAVLAHHLEHAVPPAADPRGALEAWASAYMDFALSNPARYQAMFGAVGDRHPGLDVEQLPGSTVFAGLRARLAAIEIPPGEDDALAATACLWAALHGLASLRISKPSFPWPPLAQLLARTLDAHTRTAESSTTPQPQARAAPTARR